MTTHRTAAELEAALDQIRQSPSQDGTVALIVRRPAENEREVLEQGDLDVDQGLLGDSWSLRPSTMTADGSPHPEMQLNLMNARVIELLAGEQQRWPLAGDQFYVDFDLSDANLPPGTRLKIGTAVIEVTAQPHLGCAKFKERFGIEALKFVNSLTGKQLNLRGINAKVVQSGSVSAGDCVTKL